MFPFPPSIFAAAPPLLQPPPPVPPPVSVATANAPAGALYYGASATAAASAASAAAAGALLEAAAVGVSGAAVSAPTAGANVVTSAPSVPVAALSAAADAGVALATTPAGAGVLGSGAPPLVGYEQDDEEAEQAVNRCHLHTKPQLQCKFCRKYKSFAQQLGVLQKRELRLQEDGDVQKRNMVEMTDSITYNVNSLLRANILASEYFKSLHELKSVPEVVDEIAQYAHNAEPYCSGSSRAPSTLFCCLYKLFTMKLTTKQMEQLLDNTDSPYVRCTGFLYLRYIHPPEKLWGWYEPYFLDDEEFAPGADPNRVTTIGEFVESLLTEDKYFNTVLPRLPVKVKNLYGAQLMAMEEHRKRKAHNVEQIDKFTAGASVQACSKGDWLEGEVMAVEEESRSVWVQLEDGNEELIDLGLVVLLRKKEKKSKKRKKEREHSVSPANGGGAELSRRKKERNRSLSASTPTPTSIAGSGSGGSGGADGGGGAAAAATADRATASKSPAAAGSAECVGGVGGAGLTAKDQLGPQVSNSSHSGGYNSSSSSGSRAGNNNGSSSSTRRRSESCSSSGSRGRRRALLHAKKEREHSTERRSSSVRYEKKRSSHWSRRTATDAAAEDGSSVSSRAAADRETAADRRRSRDRRGRSRSRSSSSRRRRRRSSHRRRSSSSTSRSRSASPRAKTQHDLLSEFRKKEREKALATGKDYARRPTSYKSSLSLKLSNSTHSAGGRLLRPCTVITKRTDKSPSRDDRHRSSSKRPHSSTGGSSSSNYYSRGNHASALGGSSGTVPSTAGLGAMTTGSGAAATTGTNTSEPSQERLKKMRELMQRYNRSAVDASGFGINSARDRDEETPDVLRFG